MDLPAINLPQIHLPFELPILLHPAVVHFVIAIPVVIFLMEFYNLFTKRKSIGAFAFILLLITVGMLILAYLTGIADGKEAYDLLTPEGQTELKAHKLLGVYVLFTAIAVVFFKLLAMTGKGFFRFLYFMFLIGLIAISFKQGEEGGELVFEHGANSERVKTLDDELFDTKEALEEMSEKGTKAKVQTPTIEKVTKATSNENVAESEKIVSEVSNQGTIESKSQTVKTPAATVMIEPVTAEKPVVQENISDEALNKAIDEVRTVQ